MKKILCLYYSRTGTTRAAMEQIAELLDAELVEITDGKARKGIFGFLGSGLDAMKKLPEELQPMETEQDLGAYEHVILGTPVWAGRCSRWTAIWRSPTLSAFPCSPGPRITTRNCMILSACLIIPARQSNMCRKGR